MLRMRKLISVFTLASVLIGLFCFLPLGGLQEAKAAPAGFVHTNGTQFVLDGKPFYFQGTNIYYAGLIDYVGNDWLTEADVDELMRECASKGIKVIRMWAFANGDWYDIQTIQPSLGQYNETALRRLDYAVKKAKDNGIRVILPFVNYWDEYNGMQWYVNEALGVGKSKYLFYTDATVKQHYKNYVNMLINRTNHHTGVKYKDEPAIFAWELANEPGGNDNRGDNVYNWISEMAKYVKQLDPHHMVATGEEGFKTGGSGWTEDGSKGVDFERNVKIPEIDFATIHCYPDWWHKDLNWVDWFIEDRAKTAHSANKPIVLEEYGRFDSHGDRDAAYTRWHSLANRLDYGGFAVWQMVKTIRDTHFDFTFDSSTAGIIASNANYLNNKDEGSTEQVKYDFEGSTQGWTSQNISDGPWSVTEWSSNGSRSLKADIQLAARQEYYLELNRNDNLSGKNSLKARVRHASWGNMGTGMQAKIFIKTGTGWTWYDGGTIDIGAGTEGTTLTLGLAGIADLDNVCAVGVQFIAGNGASGKSAIYVDYVTVE